MNGRPTRFDKSPLVEAIFEMRFTTAPDRGVELLPGVMLSALGREFPRVEQLPLGALPRDIRARPEFQHAPVFKLQGENQVLQLGDRVVAFNVTGPYPGWPRFRDRAVRVAQALRASEQIVVLDRYSLKYLNLIDSPEAGSPTDPFNVRVEAQACELLLDGFRLRFETTVRGFRNIVEIASNATAAGRPEKHGTMLSLDTIAESVDPHFWNHIPERLDAAHEVLEHIFLALLRSETISAMGPSYD
jgi:uncharacterized protein (TIGR04255 family)